MTSAISGCTTQVAASGDPDLPKEPSPTAVAPPAATYLVNKHGVIRLYYAVTHTHTILSILVSDSHSLERFRRADGA